MGSGGSWKNGEEVYAKVCGYYHQTGIDPVIKGHKPPPEYIVHVVRNGQLAMLAFTASFIDNRALQKAANYISKPAAEQK